MVQLADSAGTVTKAYRYDAFGVEKEPDKGDQNPFRYCGEYYDKETGSIYLRARYYEPRTGRFRNEDPIRDGLNWYTYCLGNPITFTDPTGLYNEELQKLAEDIYFMTKSLNIYDADSSYSFITSEQLKSLDWKSTQLVKDAKTLNIVMTYYGINTNTNSMRMFLATLMVESDKSKKTLEDLNGDGTRVGGGSIKTRGAGYGQISDSAHAAFLKFMKDDYKGENTAEYISENYWYSMMSAGWAWTQRSYGADAHLHDYIVKNGGGDGVFLVVTYFYNGYPLGYNDQLAYAQATNDFTYNYKANNISVKNKSFTAPNGWSERLTYYNTAISIWR